MDAQIRQTYVAMFLAITFITFVIHGIVILTFGIAVDSEACQFIAKILTGPASSYENENQSVTWTSSVSHASILGAATVGHVVCWGDSIVWHQQKPEASRELGKKVRRALRPPS